MPSTDVRPATEVVRALAVLCEPPDDAHVRVAHSLGLPPTRPADHWEVFGLHLPPYASLWTGPEGMLGGVARERVAGFWRALRLDVPAEPDHLAALLGLYAALADAEAAEADAAASALRRQSRRALLDEHLLPWVPVFADAVAALDPRGPAAAWAGLLVDVLLAEAEGLPGATAPVGLPAVLRDAAPPLAADDPVPAWVDAALTPSRSGVALTRADLAEAARTLGLAVRMGDRRLVLTALLRQDAAAVLHWLAGHADGWAALHRARAARLGGVATWWAERADHTARSARQRARSVQEPAVPPPQEVPADVH
ncbi:MAG: molecular chaperone TorD family protein [Actinomycetes bacterium]